MRYEWYFGDGTFEDKPDTAKVYRFPGTYQVTHVVTGNLGESCACRTSSPSSPRYRGHRGNASMVPGLRVKARDLCYP